MDLFVPFGNSTVVACKRPKNYNIWILSKYDFIGTNCYPQVNFFFKLEKKLLRFLLVWSSKNKQKLVEERKEWGYLLVSVKRVEVDDHGLFFFREVASLDVRPQVIDPPQSAALAAPVEACFPGEVTPSPMAFLLYELAQLRVFLSAPRPFLQPVRLMVVTRAARRSNHFACRGVIRWREANQRRERCDGLWIESVCDLETSEERPLAFIIAWRRLVKQV